MLVFPSVPVTGWVPSLVLLLAGIAAITSLMARHYPHPAFGWANTVTLVRLGLAVSLVTPLLAGMPAGWAVALLGGVALALDGVDGWLARRHGRTSAFGARFDMEVDSLLSVVLAVHAMLGGPAGPVLLVLGLTRYVFVAATWALPWLAAPLPESLRRKAVCVLQLATLILLQLPGWPPALALAASAALLWSFAVDILWLAGRRA
ncbi:MAG: CDP-alcohol phosphatidyltransferase [Fulvimarina sp.]|nr:CDP-alcohol phosphatidyltransferase [Fulvimarina sp.]